jgi:hypothetical protein
MGCVEPECRFILEGRIQHQVRIGAGKSINLHLYAEEAWNFSHKGFQTAFDFRFDVSLLSLAEFIFQLP